MSKFSLGDSYTDGDGFSEGGNTNPIDLRVAKSERGKYEMNFLAEIEETLNEDTKVYEMKQSSGWGDSGKPECSHPEIVDPKDENFKDNEDKQDVLNDDDPL